MAFCVECGNPLMEKAKFCRQCGTSTMEAMPLPLQPSPESVTTDLSSSSKTKSSDPTHQHSNANPFRKEQPTAPLAQEQLNGIPVDPFNKYSTGSSSSSSTYSSSSSSPPQYPPKEPFENRKTFSPEPSFSQLRSTTNSSAVTDIQMAEFVGPKYQEYYQKAFDQKYSWNWSCLCLSGVWMPYRKMYGEAVASVIANYVLLFFYIFGLNLNNGNLLGYIVITALYLIVLLAFNGLIGNFLYYRFCKRRISYLLKNDANSDLRSFGGTNKKAAWIAAGVWLLVILLPSFIQGFRENYSDARIELNNFSVSADTVIDPKLDASLGIKSIAIRSSDGGKAKNLKSPYLIPNDGDIAWVISLFSSKPSIIWREEITMPSPPKEIANSTDRWSKCIMSNAGKTCTQERVPDDSKEILHVWEFEPGDPKGKYFVRLYADSQLVRSFTFDIY